MITKKYMILYSNTMRKLYSITVFIFLFGASALSQDFVYTPKNPAFGGDTFNYNWLLASAQAQNLIEDPNSRGFSSTSSLDNFAESLNRQLLSTISRELISNQFGEEGLQEGIYSIGDFQIDIASSLEGLTITLFDTLNGEQTQIVIPFF
jgi:curli production assembly/transport component CsgF